jgi:hypothetical protein
MGRWSSNTYLKYIQPQIAQLVAGAAAQMAPPQRYQRALDLNRNQEFLF